jgi:hypothetical protein
MSEIPCLLHNMSAPPKSVVKYAGLASLAPRAEQASNASLQAAGRHPFGTIARFCLPSALQGAAPAAILLHLNIAHDEASQGTPARHLQTLVDARASELPLPAGCAVIRSHDQHPVLWDDTLAVLAVLAKSTDTVWLRDKSPTLSAAVQRGAVSLLIPTHLSHLLNEACP